LATACIREIEKPLASECGEFGLAAHVFDWTDAANHVGIERDAMYLVRPDGHVAMASSERSVMKLRAFLERVGLRFGAAVT
jgi:aromatic ring hydroxylase-like protein